MLAKVPASVTLAIDANRVLDLASAARLREEIEKRFPEYVNLIDPKPATIEQAQKSLKPGEALIATYAGEDRLFVWAVPHQGPPAFASTKVKDSEVEALVTELRRALDLAADHLSLYQLTIEPGTAYARLARQGKLKVPDDDEAADLYELTQDICEASGRPAYEVSNHAKSGAESRHNLTYWRYGDYAGVGPGAHGRLTVGGTRVATKAERLPEKWLNRVARYGHSFEYEEILPAAAARENLLMALRLSEGLDLKDYESRWSVELPRAQITMLADAGIVTVEGSRITATKRGRMVLNTLLAELAA